MNIRFALLTLFRQVTAVFCIAALACGIAFGRYLSGFAYTYVTYYACLASAMIALVFLYYSAWIFIFGGELNAAIARVRAAASLQTLPP